METALQAVDLPPNLPIYDHFTQEKKRLFLENFAKCPNMSGVAEALGHGKQVIYYHLERDPEFKRAFEAVREGLVDQLEGKVYEYGQRPQNFLDRMSYLRAYRPSVWNPDKKITVDVNVTQAVSAVERLKSYDAELVGPSETTPPSPTSITDPSTKHEGQKGLP